MMNPSQEQDPIDVLGSRIGESGGSFLQQGHVLFFGNTIAAALEKVRGGQSPRWTVPCCTNRTARLNHSRTSWRCKEGRKNCSVIIVTYPIEFITCQCREARVRNETLPCDARCVNRFWFEVTLFFGLVSDRCKCPISTPYFPNVMPDARIDFDYKSHFGRVSDHCECSMSLTPGRAQILYLNHLNKAHCYLPKWIHNCWRSSLDWST